MIGRKNKEARSAGPRSIRGPAAFAVLLAVAATTAVVLVVVGTAPPTFSTRSPSSAKSPTVQAERPAARPVPDAATLPQPPQAASERGRATVSELAALADAIREETDPTLREERIRLFIDRLEAGGFPEAMARLSLLLSGPLGDQLGARIMRRWAEADVEAASRWAATLPEGPLRAISLEQVAIAWAGRDLARASEWARSLKVETERDDSLRMIAHEAVRTEPVAALAMAVALPAGGPRDQLLLRAASEWAATDPQSAVDWAQNIPDHPLREDVLAGVAMAWGDRNPVAAATFAAKKLPPGRQQSDAVIAIVQRWAQTDPKSAARWVAEFPESALRDAALDNLSKLWAGELRDGAPGS